MTTKSSTPNTTDDTSQSAHSQSKSDSSTPLQEKRVNADAIPKEDMQPIYTSTHYARRLERHQRAREKRLSWQDVRQFSQFVLPFKWEIVLAFILTVGIGLTALPLPYIFRIMLDQVFHQHNVQLFIWSLCLLGADLLLEELLSYFNRNVTGSLSEYCEP